MALKANERKNKEGSLSEDICGAFYISGGDGGGEREMGVLSLPHYTLR